MKRVLLILSISVLFLGCDKHDVDYKKNIPDGEHVYPPEEPEEPEEEREYTIEDLNRFVVPGPGDYRNVDRFIQGYMTVTEVDVVGEMNGLGINYVVRLLFNGPVVKGGLYKNDPCDEGFNEIADACGDIYGPYDVVEYSEIAHPVVVCRNNIKYDVYVIGGNYDKDHPDGALINDLVVLRYEKRLKRPFNLGKWTETFLWGYGGDLTYCNERDETMIAVTKHSSLQITFPEHAGTYSFRVVAKSGDDILCNKIIENVELPARK